MLILNPTTEKNHPVLRNVAFITFEPSIGEQYMINSGIYGKFLFYSLIAKTMVCFHKVARLLNLKFVRGLQDDQAEMTETSGQCR